MVVMTLKSTTTTTTQYLWGVCLKSVCFKNYKPNLPWSICLNPVQKYDDSELVRFFFRHVLKGRSCEHFPSALTVMKDAQVESSPPAPVGPPMSGILHAQTDVTNDYSPLSNLASRGAPVTNWTAE